MHARLSAYPLTVEAMNTRYGPRRFLTRGRGMAAASSIHTSSACSSLWLSPGWMYWEGRGSRMRQGEEGRGWEGRRREGRGRKGRRGGRVEVGKEGEEGSSIHT